MFASQKHRRLRLRPGAPGSLRERPAFRGAKGDNRRGLTLVELLIASAVMAIVVGAMSTLALTVQTSHDHGWRAWTATQHARVALGRIERTVLTAHANEQFPGAVVFNEREAGVDFPETLVVWKGEPAPADGGGLPRWNELAVYCPNPAAPNELLEITAPTDVRAAPSLADTAAWRNGLATMKAAAGSKRVMLTDSVRTASLPGGAIRGAVRFVVRLRPTAAEWAAFRAGSQNWDDLAWPQGAGGASIRSRQTWCAIELQMQAWEGTGGATAVPYFGSAALTSPLER